MTDQTFTALVAEVPGEVGWVSPAARDVFERTAERLSRAGIGLEEIRDILDNLYWAAVNQFGM